MTVTPEDIAVELGRPTPLSAAVQAQWQSWINAALLLLRVGDGDHDGFGNLSGLDQDVVDYVVTQAVVGMARRPDDATTVDIQIDDGRMSRSYSTGQGRVFIRDEWWAMLAGADGESFSIGPC